MAKWVDTESYFKIRECEKRIVVVQGGTSAGKTYDICAILADLSFDIKNEIISITTDTFPNLRRGAMRDMKNFLASMNWQDLFVENKSTSSFRNRVTDTVIEFFSCDEMGALGARRDYLFVNEANRINYETFTQLEIRTRKKIYLDFNPVNRFWAHTELIDNKERADEVDFLKLNYLDNKDALEPSIVKSIESRKGDGNNNWWRVYGLGEIGSLEGNVYEGWLPVEEKPEGFVLKRYGVDFGYNDPVVVVAVYENENKDIYLELELYQTKILTPVLVEKLKELEPVLFVCDNARPEIIAELQANGIRAIGCDKTPGEKMNGKRYNIELVLRRKVYYRASDKELEQEYLSYAWRKKKTGEVINEPEDGNDHCMDAIAYAVRDMERKPIEYGRPIFG
jgi:phage terminase large subunit